MKLEAFGFKRIIFFFGARAGTGAGTSEEGGGASEEGGGREDERGRTEEAGGTVLASCSQLSGRTGWGGTSGLWEDMGAG